VYVLWRGDTWLFKLVVVFVLIDVQVINGIQTGPYKNIYNPENFFVGKNGVGAANNWGDGYQTGELVHEDIMEMIDREADGSDSLEVCLFE
jgi:tubulin gamma